jgi:regulator of replication initiation timing
MTPQTLSKIHEKIDDLIEEIEELQRQKYKLQELYDFGDFIETHNLIDIEIERLQHQLREERSHLDSSNATDPDDDIEKIVEEEEVSSPLLRLFSI